MSDPSFGALSDEKYRFYSQRLQLYLNARFTPHVEFYTKLQAIGIAGSSNPVTNSVPNPAADRYPNAVFTPWIQNAYFKAREVADRPVDLSIGRQPIRIGDGLVLSDDDLGLTGVRVQARLPWQELMLDAFTFKANESASLTSSDSDLYGAELALPRVENRFSFFWLLERDGSGTLYRPPAENPANLPAALVPTTSRITRHFLDVRAEGKLLKGGFYKLELAVQRGYASRNPALGLVKFEGSMFLLSGGLYARRTRFGPFEVHASFGQASGDDPATANTDEAFNPTFGHRFDGLERSGFGEFYGASLYDAFGSSANPRGLPPGTSGIRVLGTGLTMHPLEQISVGADYYLFSVRENTSGFSPSSDGALGTELDLGLGVSWTSYLSFRASFAQLFPGQAFGANRTSGRRLLIEAIGRF